MDHVAKINQWTSINLQLQKISVKNIFWTILGQPKKKELKTSLPKKVASKLEKMRNFPIIGISGTKGGLNLGNRKGYLTSHKKFGV